MNVEKREQRNDSSNAEDFRSTNENLFESNEENRRRFEICSPTNSKTSESDLSGFDSTEQIKTDLSIPDEDTFTMDQQFSRSFSANKSSSSSFSSSFSVESNDRAGIVNRTQRTGENEENRSVNRFRTNSFASTIEFDILRSTDDKSTTKQRNETIFRSSLLFTFLCVTFSWWLPLSSFCFGCLVGICLGLCSIVVGLSFSIEEKSEGKIDFSSLESTLDKVRQEEKSTSIQSCPVSICFDRYEVDRDEEFIRFPCELRLDGYRLILQLPMKSSSEERRPDKETKFIGYREYLVKEARMILVPEATLTRAKYWMNEYPIVIDNLQILDKQLVKKQVDKTKLNVDEFFSNTSQVISIWFDSSVQKEDSFHKFSLALRKGKQEIERTNSLLNERSEARRTNEFEFQALSDSLERSRVQFNEQKDKVDSNSEIRSEPKKISLEKILRSSDLLDEASLNINLLARRFFSENVDISSLETLVKNKIEKKLGEVSLSIFDEFRVTSIDLGQEFPLVLKVDPMQWNTQGLWFSFFIFSQGKVKISIRNKIFLEKLIDFDPNRDEPLFKQKFSSDLIDSKSFAERQKILAEEPQFPEMSLTRKFGESLTNLANNTIFQKFVKFPLVKKLVERLSGLEFGVDVEVERFHGFLSANLMPPPSDRIWIGFAEMPEIKINVVPVFGSMKLDFFFVRDILLSRIRTEIKRLLVLPAMDDQLIDLFRNWTLDVIEKIAEAPFEPNIEKKEEQPFQLTPDKVFFSLAANSTVET